MSATEPPPELSLEQFREALRQPAPGSSTGAAPVDALVWLAVVPFWPVAVAQQGFPADNELRTGGAVTELLDELAETGWVDVVTTSAPWAGDCYRMSRSQRGRALDLWREQQITSTRDLPREVARIAQQLSASQKAFEALLPSALRHWCAFVTADSGAEKAPRTADPAPATSLGIADALTKAVSAALSGARALGLDGSPDAATLIDAAEPLAIAFGGPVRVAVARSQRDLELHHRRSRDGAQLSNYQERPDLDRSLADILDSRTSWMIHYLGGGGVGKTMFLRHLQADLASQLRLATARVDFDHLNPDYPLRSPGLLLLSFAEELRLEAPEQAIDYLRKLEVEVTNVHAELEIAQRSGRDVPLGFSAPGFEFCLSVFAETLQVFERAGRRPVLILDTCEELVRLRFDGTLPATVVETFKILDRLHALVPNLRVVLSGRRPLAQTPDYPPSLAMPLPPRSDVVVRPILGFTREEALQLLAKYRRPDKGGTVPADLHEGILELSASADAQSGDWYNPFDVNLYAGWAAGDNALTRDKLAKAGKHHYVRERVVARLRDDVRRWVPHLTLLGRFDEDLVAGLSSGGGGSSVWTELRQQEWIDPDRNAPVQSPTMAQAPVAFWSVDEQMRRKLRALYIDEMPAAWSDASRHVGELLRHLTLSRDWPALTPSYFHTAAEALKGDREAAAIWWRGVEEKILDTQEWDWADRITASLLDDAAFLDGHPLAAPVYALRANVEMRVSAESQALDGLWSEAARTASGYPDPHGRAVLEYRAAAGRIAHLRYRPDTLKESQGPELENLLGQVKRLPDLLFELSGPELATLKLQAVHTEVALLDNAVEVLEQVHWSSAPSGLVSLILLRASDLKQHAGGTLQSDVEESSVDPWIDIYCQRARVPIGVFDAQWSWQAAAFSVPPRALQHPGFDYVQPDDARSRRLLECGRLLERGKSRERARQFAEIAFRTAGEKTTLDQERLASQAYRLLPELSRGGGREVLSQSLRAADQREKCQAHRQVIPLWATAIQVHAVAGDIDAAMDLLDRARAGPTSEQMKRRLDRVSAYVNGRYRLALPTSQDATLPELPRFDDDPLVRPVEGFMHVTAEFLRDASKGLLTPVAVARQIELADQVCAGLGFQRPLSVADLQQIPAGWRPWFARHLVVCTWAENHTKLEERQQLAGYLRTLYGTELPTDVAFLDARPAVPAGGSDAEPAVRTRGGAWEPRGALGVRFPLAPIWRWGV
jgi:hypothetical protein